MPSDLYGERICYVMQSYYFFYQQVYTPEGPPQLSCRSALILQVTGIEYFML
jgi:hypothetical protein